MLCFVLYLTRNFIHNKKVYKKIKYAVKDIFIQSKESRRQGDKESRLSSFEFETSERGFNHINIMKI